MRSQFCTCPDRSAVVAWTKLWSDCIIIFHILATRRFWNFDYELINPLWNGSRIEPLLWRHNERDSVSNHQPQDCLLNRLFRCRSKKTSKLRVTGLCEGNSPVTGEFPAQRASNAENVSIDDVIMQCIQVTIWNVTLVRTPVFVSMK